MTTTLKFTDRPLIDKYGHRHSAAVLTNWSPGAIKALGIRKVPTPETETQPEEEHEMPDYSDCYGGRFMKAGDINKPFNGIIERAERTEVEKGKPKVVVHFEGHDKGIVLNATRYTFLCELAKSKDTDDWPGLTVGVRRGRTNFAGKMVDCIEFGMPTKKAKTAEALDDAITF